MSSAVLTSKERVLMAFKREEIDKYAVINPTSIATIESMNISNSYFPQAHIDGNKMAELAAVGHDVLGFDSVMPYYSIQLEAFALGCKVDWGTKDSMPKIVENLSNIKGEYNFKHEFVNEKPINELLKAIKLLKKKYGDKVAIIGKVIGPLTLAYHLYGAQNILLDYIVNQKKLKELLSELVNISISLAQKQFEAGADIVTWADHATSDLLSEKGYAELLLPLHKKATQQLKSSGPTILHICGNVMDRLKHIKKSGFDCFHIDSRNNLKEAVESVGSNIILTGAVNNPQTLIHGTRIDIKNEVDSIIKSGIFLISPECAIPSRVPNKNLKIVVETAHSKRFKSYNI